MIDAQRRAQQVAGQPAGTERAESALSVLAEEMATYRERLPGLLGAHENRFVLIQGSDVAGILPDRPAALREGYRRFGIVPFLVRQITAAEPMVYLPNVLP